MWVREEVYNPRDLADMLWGQSKEHMHTLCDIGRGERFIEMLEEQGGGEDLDLGDIHDTLAYDFDAVLQDMDILCLMNDTWFIRWLFDQQYNGGKNAVTLAEIQEEFPDMDDDNIEDEVDQFTCRHYISAWRSPISWDADEGILDLDFDENNTIESY